MFKIILSPMVRAVADVGVVEESDTVCHFLAMPVFAGLCFPR